MGSASTIPLQGVQPSFTTPSQYAQQGLGLQSLALGNALQSQQLKQAAVQAQQQAAELAANQTANQSFVANGGNYEKTRADLVGKVPMSYLQKLDQDNLKNQQAHLALSNEQRTQQQTQDIATGAEAAALLQLPYEQRAVQLPGAMARLQKQGIDTTQYQNADPTDDALKYTIARSNYGKQVASWADTQAQEQQRKAAAIKSTQQAADEAQKAQQAKAAQSREDIARQYLGVNDQPTHDAWMDAVNKNYPEVAKEYANFKTFGPGNAQIINGMALNAQQRSTNAVSQQKLTDAEQKAADAANTTGIPKNEWEGAYAATDASLPPKERADAALKRLDASKLAAKTVTNINIGSSNGEPSATAQAVANYAAPYSQAVARLPAAQREEIMKQVMKINPDFHAEYYDNFNKTEKDATTGRIGTTSNAIGTMLGHLNVLNQAADALKNSDIQALNRIANFFGAQTGSTPITVYNTIVHRLAPEVTKAYVAGGGSAGERGANESDFDAKLGPDQIKQNIGISALLAASKIKNNQMQYDRGTYGRGKQQLLSPESDSVRQQLIQQAPANVRGDSPLSLTYKGHIFTFTDPAKMAQFKKDQGIQ